jgi:hypothetical protein
VKALTLTQPWATLVVRGIKRCETRSWHYGYSDNLPMPLAIHAAKGQDADAREFAEYLVRSGVLDTADLPRGAIVGTVRYVGWDYAYPTLFEELKPSDLELELGDWSDGRVIWRFDHPREFDEPIPRRGELGVWNWLAPDYEGLEAAIAGKSSR